MSEIIQTVLKTAAADTEGLRKSPKIIQRQKNTCIYTVNDV